MMVHLRALLVVKISGLDFELLQLPHSEGETLARLAESFSDQDLVRFFSILSKTEQDIRTSSQPRFHLEMGLMKLVHARRLYRLEEALDRLSNLESRIGSGAAGSGGAEPAARPPAQRDPVRPAPASSAARSSERPQRESAEPPARFASTPRREAASDGGGTSAPEPPASKAAAQKESKAPPSAAPAGMKRAAAPEPFEEPPPLLEEPYEIAQELPQPVAGRAGDAVDGADAIDRIKNALEGRRKMLLLTMLNAAETIEVDGDFLRISFPTSGSISKSKVESRDNRQVLDEVCREVFGRPMRLSVSVGAQTKTGPAKEGQAKEGSAKAAPAEGGPGQKEAPSLKDKAENHPAVRALADKFHGKVVDVIKPEN
jgi:DNA polymerase-3 subunit gamma/tau